MNTQTNSTKRRITPELVKPASSNVCTSTSDVSPLPLSEESSNSSEKECIICYESLSSTKNMCITECGHEFCFSCMMKHVRHNNGCPICRSVIIEDISDSDDEETISEYEEEDDETIEEEVDESYPEFTIEQFMEVFEAKGYGLKDALSLLMCKFSKTDEKYTKTYISKLEEDIEDMNEELQSECEERDAMASEDRR